jgi:hypothetical protein
MRPSQPGFDHLLASPKERGSSLAWTAIFLTAVVLPLLMLVAEGSHWFIIRGRLQAATDAACEDAAWSSADMRTFRSTGRITFADLPQRLQAAQSTFYSTLSVPARMGYQASLQITPDLGAAAMHCSGLAAVRATLPKSRPMHILVRASSAIRFTR